MLSSFFLENLVLCDHGASYDDISGIRPKSRNSRGAVCWYFLLLRTPLNEIRTLLSNVNLSRVLMWHITSLYLSFLLLARYEVTETFVEGYCLLSHASMSAIYQWGEAGSFYLCHPVTVALHLFPLIFLI